MKKIEISDKAMYRELKDHELHETYGGLCLFPFLVGQKAGEWLKNIFTPEH